MKYIFTLILVLFISSITSASPLRPAIQEDSDFSEEEVENTPNDRNKLCQRTLLKEALDEDPFLLPITKQDTINEISSFEQTQLKKADFSRRERKLIQNMYEDTLFENWNQLPSNTPFKTSNGFLVTKVEDKIFDNLPVFIFESKKYIVSESSILNENNANLQRPLMKTKSKINVSKLVKTIKTKVSSKMEDTKYWASRKMRVTKYWTSSKMEDTKYWASNLAASIKNKVTLKSATITLGALTTLGLGTHEANYHYVVKPELAEQQRVRELRELEAQKRAFSDKFRKTLVSDLDPTLKNRLVLSLSWQSNAILTVVDYNFLLDNLPEASLNETWTARTLISDLNKSLGTNYDIKIIGECGHLPMILYGATLALKRDPSFQTLPFEKRLELYKKVEPKILFGLEHLNETLKTDLRLFIYFLIVGDSTQL